MSVKPTKRSMSGMAFLLAVVTAYVVTYVFDKQLALDSLVVAKDLFYRLAPMLLLVFVLMFLSNLFIRPDWIRKHVGKESGARGWAIAVAGGMLSLGPVYPWYALLRDLKTKGMRTALVAVFLYARSVKLPLLPIMVHYFGVAFTLVLMAYLTLFSLLSGLVMEKLVMDASNP